MECYISTDVAVECSKASTAALAEYTDLMWRMLGSEGWKRPVEKAGCLELLAALLSMIETEVCDTRSEGEWQKNTTV